ncbi:MAG: hypothetical protein HQK72_07295 [Desulfamplus sp.]|nr:hypothetical protein [Desulfamplus sp.]
MNTILQKKVFSSLQISQEQILDEIAILMAYQKRSEFIAEVDWYKQKYKMDFSAFDNQFRQQPASEELENDWMAWRFAEEGVQYWNNLLKEIPNDSGHSA